MVILSCHLLTWFFVFWQYWNFFLVSRVRLLFDPTAFVSGCFTFTISHFFLFLFFYLHSHLPPVHMLVFYIIPTKNMTGQFSFLFYVTLPFLRMSHSARDIFGPISSPYSLSFMTDPSQPAKKSENEQQNIWGESQQKPS